MQPEAIRPHSRQLCCAKHDGHAWCASLTEVAEGHIRITAPILPGMRQQQGFGHAGLTFSIGDSAAGYAALTSLPLDMDVVTAEIKINLLAPARGDRLIAIGQRDQTGQTVCVSSPQKSLPKWTAARP